MFPPNRKQISGERHITASTEITVISSTARQMAILLPNSGGRLNMTSCTIRQGSWGVYASIDSSRQPSRLLKRSVAAEIGAYDRVSAAPAIRLGRGKEPAEN